MSVTTCPDARPSRGFMATMSAFGLMACCFGGIMVTADTPATKMAVVAVVALAELVKLEAGAIVSRLSSNAAKVLILLAMATSVVASVAFVVSQPKVESLYDYVDHDVWVRTNGCTSMLRRDVAANDQCASLPDRFLNGGVEQPRHGIGVLGVLAVVLQALSVIGPIRQLSSMSSAKPEKGGGAVVAALDPEVVATFPEYLDVRQAPPQPAVALPLPYIKAQDSRASTIDVKFEDVVTPKKDKEEEMFVVKQETQRRFDIPDEVSGNGFVYGTTAKIEEIDWLWPGLLQVGVLNLIGGTGGVGKSTIASYIAATTTKVGATWPTGEVVKSGCVIHFETEDQLSSVTVPRFIAAGGNRSRIAFCDQVMDLAVSIGPLVDVSERLERATAMPVRLLILSELRQFFGAKESFNATQVRKAIAPVLDWAKKNDVCVVGIMHPKQNQDAFAGSSVWKDAARSGIFAKRTGAVGSQRVLSALKANNAPDDWVLPYDTKGFRGQGFESSYVVWGERAMVGGAASLNEEESESGESANGGETVTQSETRRKAMTPMERAVRYLKGALEDGPKDGAILKAEAAELNPPIGKNTLEAAADDMGIVRDELDESGRLRPANRKTWCTPDQYAERERKRALIYGEEA